MTWSVQSAGVVTVTDSQRGAEERKQLAETLGLSDTSAATDLSLSDLRTEIEASTDPAYASIGEAIRADTRGELDAELIEGALSDMATQIGHLDEVREAGIPGGEQKPERLYRTVAEPGRRVYEHLVDVGFFESTDENLPRFTADHIERTARELIGAEPLTAELAELGFDGDDQLELVMNVTNNRRRLSRWVPTTDIPEGVEFAVEHVPPLHQRAAGGALLWIENLDVHLWQKQVLLTDEILDDAAADTRGMLAGLYLMTRAALAVADPEQELTDSQLTAALAAGTAITIIDQENVCQDVYRITEEMRAPNEFR